MCPAGRTLSKYCVKKDIVTHTHTETVGPCRSKRKLCARSQIQAPLCRGQGIDAGPTVSNEATATLSLCICVVEQHECYTVMTATRNEPILLPLSPSGSLSTVQRAPARRF